MILHIPLVKKTHRWFVIAIPIGALTEVIGWVGRTLSATRNDYSDESGNYFILQIVALTIAPVFFSACLYYTQVLVSQAAPHLARFNPRKLAVGFLASDIISLVLQAVGGGMAASADSGSEEQDTGTDIMVAGAYGVHA